MLNITVGNLLCNQSPALFLVAFYFLILFFVRKKNHKVKAGFDMILFIISLVLAVGLYFFGMAKEYFTIKDFYEIRISGWIGLVAVTVLIIVTLIRRAVHKVDDYRKARQEAKKEAAAAAEAEIPVQENPVYQETVPVAYVPVQDEPDMAAEPEMIPQIPENASLEGEVVLEDPNTPIQLNL